MSPRHPADRDAHRDVRADGRGADLDARPLLPVTRGWFLVYPAETVLAKRSSGHELLG